MLPTLAALALLAGQSAPAEKAVKPVVGVVPAPCSALPVVPASVVDFTVRAIKAKAAHLAAPVRTAEEKAVYRRWQDALLLADFPGLCRYRAENATLPPPGPDRIVFFGDSITEFWRREDRAFFEGDRIDRGIAGQTTSQMVARFRADVIALRPKVVHIMAGTNDIAGNTGPTSLAAIENNLATMSELARAHGIRVVLASVPPAAGFDWRPEINPVEDIRALNRWIAEYARRENLSFIDYYSALEDPRHAFRRELTDDGVHPNKAGYAVMRAILEKELRKSRG